MIKLKLHKTKINGQQFGYWSNGIKNPRRTCLLLAPGSHSGKFFKNFERYFDSRDLWICPDYPGRGYSLPQLDNSINSTSETVAQFINVLKLDNLNLIGFSYGTQIATQLIRNDDKKYKKIILIASGRYYSNNLRKLLISFFDLIGNFKLLMQLIRNLIRKVSYIPNKNLKELNMQWLSTLKYKIPVDFATNVPTIFVDFNKDQCVVRESRDVLRKVFANYKSYSLDKKHPVKKADFDEVFIKLWKTIYE